MQNNVYGAELDLKIDKFKSKMKEAQNISKETGKKIADNTKFNVWENGVMTLSNGVQLVKKSEKELNNEIEDTGKVTQTAGNEISKAFSKGLKSVKRLTIGFLGARSAFGLFKKYMSEYSSQNEEFAQKMQLTTNVITTALAPAFEFFGNVIQYAVIGLARIIELLTGVNILGKTIDTSFKGASKSAKEFNENLSGLDEISNIDQSASGLSTGIGSQLNALNDFQKKVEEVKALFERWGIAKKLETIKTLIENVWNSTPMQLMREAIENIVNWAIEHPDAVAIILGGMGLVSLISKIMGSAGGTGLLGLVDNIKYLAGLGAIALTITLLYEGKKKAQEWFDETTDSIEEGSKKTTKAIEESGKKITEAIETNDKETAQKIFDNKVKSYDEIMKSLQELDSMQSTLNTPWGKSTDWIFGETGRKKTLDSIKEIKTATQEYINQFKQLYEANMLTKEQEDTYKSLIANALTYKDTLGLTKKEMDSLLDDYLELDKSPKTVQNITDAMIQLGYTEDEIKIKLKEIFDPTYKIKMAIDSTVFGSITNTVNKALKSVGIKLPSYDVGTDYVPSDQIAMIHEGERIIPKQYNNPDYLGQLGNSETNMLLLELNRSILEFAKRPSVINVNGRELAKATYNDYQEESSRRGTNTAVRRV